MGTLPCGSQAPGHELGVKERCAGSEGWACQSSGDKAVQQVSAPSRCSDHGTPWKSFSRWSSDGKLLLKPTVQNIIQGNSSLINRSTKQQGILNTAVKKNKN